MYVYIYIYIYTFHAFYHVFLTLDAQNAIGVAENGMAQGSPTLRIS